MNKNTKKKKKQGKILTLTHCGKYLDQNQGEDFHLGLVLSAKRKKKWETKENEKKKETRKKKNLLPKSPCVYILLSKKSQPLSYDKESVSSQRFSWSCLNKKTRHL